MVENYNDFRKALQFVLKWEGGYVNDPTDPGGETKWGISKKAHPNEDIRNLTPEHAADIYAEDYWMPSGCPNINFPYNVAVFDTAVNIGVGPAVRLLRDCKNPSDYLEARKQYYYKKINLNPTLSKYLRGWLNRVNDLQKFIEINIAEKV